MIKKHSTMNLKHSFKDGFTMVELSLSLVFIAILSIAVVLVMTGAISSYHRSITLNKVENVGASLVRDMKASIQNAPPDRLALLCDDIYANTSYNDNNDTKKKCVDDGGKNFASVTRYAYVKVNKNSEQKGKQMPVFGALCTGSYTYIWNSGYFFDPTSY
jgi:type II secretory pathway pseudopilin PulG